MQNILKRSVYWIGSVDEKHCDQVLEKLTALCKDNDTEEATLFICSGGGDTKVCFAFYDIVRTLHLNLTTVASGEASSAAVIVWLAGLHRLITPHTVVFLHENEKKMHDGVQLRPIEMESQTRQAKATREQYVKIMASASSGKCSREVVRKLLAQNTVLEPSETIKYGMAHGILKQRTRWTLLSRSPVRAVFS